MCLLLSNTQIYNCHQTSTVEQFTTWHNPMELLELKVPEEDKCMAWKTQTLTEKTWREHARLAWELSPVLAVFLPSRLVSITL